MRIEFTHDTTVELSLVPNTEWGRLQKRVAVMVPRLDAVIDAFRLEQRGEMGHYFPAGVCPDLPDDMASGFIAAGVARDYDGPKFTGEVIE